MKLQKDLEIIGITLITSNEEAIKQNTIGQLWSQFLQTPFLDKLSGVENTSVYSVYSDYENRDQGTYRVTLGYSVAKGTPVPATFHKTLIPSGDFQTFACKSASPTDIVEAWKQVWSQDPKTFSRQFLADFELYEGDKVTLHIGFKDGKFS
jgi:predicted transcriptional regulator YdeE